LKNILISGGAGFIGSHVVRCFVIQYPSTAIVNLDALSYAGNLNNLTDIEYALNYNFVKGDIRNASFNHDLFQEHRFDGVVNLATESHVDRSITDPPNFVATNAVGTVNLLNAFKELWKGNFTNKRFYYISTDEVYGSL
jgi:dTDP-glucose 4,6-dehydratase